MFKPKTLEVSQKQIEADHQMQESKPASHPTRINKSCHHQIMSPAPRGKSLSERSRPLDPPSPCIPTRIRAVAIQHAIQNTRSHPLIPPKPLDKQFGKRKLTVSMFSRKPNLNCIPSSFSSYSNGLFQNLFPNAFLSMIFLGCPCRDKCFCICLPSLVPSWEVLQAKNGCALQPFFATCADDDVFWSCPVVAYLIGESVVSSTCVVDTG